METKQLAYSVLTDAQKHRFEENLELDFSFGIKGLARFRANVFMQRGAVAAVYRTIPYEIRSFKELGLPPVIATICDKPRGLVLVTGPTGSGKSTTLAAMLDKINNERHEHMITIEDPIEYLHAAQEVRGQPARAARGHPLLHQRAARRPARGPRRGADRRDARPRDHRVGAAHRGDGPLDLRHPAHQLGRLDHQPHRRRVPRPPAAADPRPALAGAGGHHVPDPAAQGQRHRAAALAMEILVPNPAIRNLIREDKIHQIYSSMQTGQEKFGMQTFNQ